MLSMRLCRSAFAAAMFVLPAAASAAPDYPAGALALETRLLTMQTADAKAWIKEEASREAMSRFLTDETARNAARKFGATGSDVSTLAFLELMEAARVADSNVASLVNGVQGDAASRQDVRQQSMQQNTISGSQHSQLSSAEMSAEQNQGQAFLSLLPKDRSNDTDPAPPPPPPNPDQMQNMNLQDAMDRESEIETLLSGAMKNIS